RRIVREQRRRPAKRKTLGDVGLLEIVHPQADRPPHLAFGAQCLALSLPGREVQALLALESAAVGKPRGELLEPVDGAATREIRARGGLRAAQPAEVREGDVDLVLQQRRRCRGAPRGYVALVDDD